MGARSGQVRITYNTWLYEGRAWVRSVFNMILFLYLFDEKCESVLSTFSIPLYKNEKKKVMELLLIPVFDLFHRGLAPCHLC